jgi:hypothetical protein
MASDAIALLLHPVRKGHWRQTCIDSTYVIDILTREGYSAQFSDLQEHAMDTMYQPYRKNIIYVLTYICQAPNFVTLAFPGHPSGINGCCC